MTIEFKKFHGSFNDFIIVDNRSKIISYEDASRVARHLCNHKVGIGADGFILIENSDRCDFRWVFFNADGSEAEMCGNGARCAARFSYVSGICGRRLSFETRAGVIEAEIHGESVTVSLPYLNSTINIRDVSITYDSCEYRAHYLNTGVPHVVIFVDDLESVPVRELGRFIRFHHEFKPNGTNVNFVEKKGGNFIAIRTYERGVEDETLACGTGAIAASIVSCVLHNMYPPIEVLTKGGETLKIDFTYDRDLGVLSNVTLTGSAVFVYEGRLSEEYCRGLGIRV